MAGLLQVGRHDREPQDDGIVAEPDEPKKKLPPGAWQEARTLVWAHRKRLAVGLALMLVNRLSGLVLPSMPKWLFDEVISKQRWELLPRLAMLAGAATLV